SEPSAAASLDRRGCAAMRLLPVGPDHGGCCAVARETASYRRRYRRRHDRQPLPLRHVSARAPRHSSRGRNEGERRRTMSEILNLSRRRFLKTGALAGGGLILGVYLPELTNHTAAAQERRGGDL